MSKFTPLNKDFLPLAFGFQNYGATCYFNSLLQCLLSCTSLTEVILKNRKNPNYQKNPMIQAMVVIYKLMITYSHAKINNFPQEKIDALESQLRASGKLAYDVLIAVAQKRADKVLMNYGQQDSHEGLMIFLDCIDKHSAIKQLFEHKYATRIYCNLCKKWVVDRSDSNYVFEVQPDLKINIDSKFKSVVAQPADLESFLKVSASNIDKDFICPSCGKKENVRLSITQLRLAPEILPVVIKKYDGKPTTPFPNKIRFMSTDGNYINYALVGQCEHSGSRAGGHYWALCLRADGTYCLNDTSYTKVDIAPTPNSYLLFYHLL